MYDSEMDRESYYSYWWILLLFVGQLAITNTYTFIANENTLATAAVAAWVAAVVVWIGTILIVHVWQSVHPESMVGKSEIITLPVIVMVQMAVGATINYGSGIGTVESVVVTWVLFGSIGLLRLIHRCYNQRIGHSSVSI